MAVRLCGALVVSACTLALAACGGSTSSITGEPMTVRQLASSASTSAHTSAGKFAFSFEASIPDTDESFSFAGQGAFDVTSGRARFSFDLASVAQLLKGFFGGVGVGDWPDFDDRSAWQLEGIQDGNVSYLKFPALAAELPDGKSWVRVDAASRLETQGLDLAEFKQFDSADRERLFDYLRAVSGTVETVGREELRGTPTTHYRATVDLERYGKLVPRDSGTVTGVLTQTGTIDAPVDVWLDDQGLVRKVELSLAAAQPATGTTKTGSLTFEFWDYGKSVDIELPPASQVVDAASLHG